MFHALFLSPHRSRRTLVLPLLINETMKQTRIELSAEKYWAIQPEAFGVLRQAIISGREFELENAISHAVVRFAHGELATDCNQLTGFKAISSDWDKAESYEGGDDIKYINMIFLDGMIFRSTSTFMRNALMEAADRDDVVAHIIYARTPGGVTSALNDFTKAFDYIRARGQKLYWYCDGFIASLGVFASAKSDGVFAFNGEDEMGSIGVYRGGFVMPDGSVNAITQEKYIEIYADKSTDKNKDVRDLADGNYDAARKEINAHLDELLTNLKADRPSIKEEQMTGAMYKMKDCVGTLIDGICTLQELCEKIYADWAVSANKAVGDTTEDENNQASINPNSNNMKEFENIATALGYKEPMACHVEDGVLTLQPTEAEALDGKLKEMAGSVETLSAENTTLREREVAVNASLVTMTIERDAARKELEELRAAMAETDESKVNAVRDEMQATIDSMAAEKTALEEAKAGVEAQLATVNGDFEAHKKSAEEAATLAATRLAEKEQVINDLQAQLAEAQSGIGSKVDAGESTATNGQAAGASVMTGAPAWDPNKTPSENHAAMQAYLEEQRKKVQ